MINNKTRLNLVIGNPLGHSKSPLLHNTIYNTLNCNAVFLAHPTQDLPAAIHAIKTFSIGLTAVTMPYKEQVLPYLDSMSEEVQSLQAANTLIQDVNHKLKGYNTDVDGIAFALRDVPLINQHVLIIGAGGAARAAAYYLNKKNATLLWINRTPSHLFPLIEKFGGEIVDINAIDHYDIDIIINTTPLGMFPGVDASPLMHYQFKSHQIIFDMVYNPVETRLLRDAKSQNATCISGLDMFIGQGIKQIELWLNQSIVTTELIDLTKQKIHQSLTNSLERI